MNSLWKVLAGSLWGCEVVAVGRSSGEIEQNATQIFEVCVLYFREPLGTAELQRSTSSKVFRQTDICFKRLQDCHILRVLCASVVNSFTTEAQRTRRRQEGVKILCLAYVNSENEDSAE